MQVGFFSLFFCLDFKYFCDYVFIESYNLCCVYIDFIINFCFSLSLQKKVRKTRRQILAEKLATQQQLIKKANALTNPLETLRKFSEYHTKDGNVIKLNCIKAKDTSAELLSWIFDIMERNMKDMYERSNWGWNVTAKQKELTEETVWYLIAQCNEKFLGFSHFRFDIDNGDVVLYWYVYICIYNVYINHA